MFRNYRKGRQRIEPRTRVIRIHTVSRKSSHLKTFYISLSDLNRFSKNLTADGKRSYYAAHSDCCFFAPCTNILTSLLTYKVIGSLKVGFFATQCRPSFALQNSCHLSGLVCLSESSGGLCVYDRMASEAGLCVECFGKRTKKNKTAQPTTTHQWKESPAYVYTGQQNYAANTGIMFAIDDDDDDDETYICIAHRHKHRPI